MAASRLPTGAGEAAVRMLFDVPILLLSSHDERTLATLPRLVCSALYPFLFPREVRFFMLSTMLYEVVR